MDKYEIKKKINSLKIDIEELLDDNRVCECLKDKAYLVRMTERINSNIYRISQIEIEIKQLEIAQNIEQEIDYDGFRKKEIMDEEKEISWDEIISNVEDIEN
ncbi:MAG: hypothetical protein HPY53_12395 [Brevinematales bacterium]|nr:hypothetical protein [Brevinematales bacterium]